MCAMRMSFFQNSGDSGRTSLHMGFSGVMHHDPSSDNLSECQSEQPNPEAREFYNVLEEENTLLVCQGFTTSPLFAAAQTLRIKADRNVTIDAYNDFLFSFKSMMPPNNMSATFVDAKKKFCRLGMGIVKIDACPNDCVLYYKEHAHLDSCPTCRTSRYKNEASRKAKNRPQKVLRYMPITPRLQRLFMSRKTSGEMTWHKNFPRHDGVMTHPSHGRAWQTVDEKYPDFAAKSRNVRLGLCADGFTPFGFQARSHSIWPIMIVVYNLPPWLCMTKPFIFLSLLIPGKNSPGQNIDVYLRPLIDELNSLWTEGVITWDAAKQQNFRMRAILMWTIGDFLAYAMFFGWSTHGKLACPICMANTHAFRLNFGENHVGLIVIGDTWTPPIHSGFKSTNLRRT